MCFNHYLHHYENGAISCKGAFSHTFHLTVVNILHILNNHLWLTSSTAMENLCTNTFCIDWALIQVAKVNYFVIFVNLRNRWSFENITHCNHVPRSIFTNKICCSVNLELFTRFFLYGERLTEIKTLDNSVFFDWFCHCIKLSIKKDIVFSHFFNWSNSMIIYLNYKFDSNFIENMYIVLSCLIK